METTVGSRSWSNRVTCDSARVSDVDRRMMRTLCGSADGRHGQAASIRRISTLQRASPSCVAPQPPEHPTVSLLCVIELRRLDELWHLGEPLIGHDAAKRQLPNGTLA